MKRTLSRAGITRRTQWDLENDRPRKEERDFWGMRPGDYDTWFRPGPPLPYLTKVEKHLARAKERGAVADLTKQQWDDIKIAFGMRCAYCGREHCTLILEHFVPLCRGGGTTLSNTVPSCSRCNSQKLRQDPMVFLSKFHDSEQVMSRIRTVLNEIGAKYGKPPVSW